MFIYIKAPQYMCGFSVLRVNYVEILLIEFHPYDALIFRYNTIYDCIVYNRLVKKEENGLDFDLKKDVP